jgi:hypothetical protein
MKLDRAFACRIRTVIPDGPGTIHKFFPSTALRAARSLWLREVLRGLVVLFMIAGLPALLLAEYSENKMGEYLHYALAAANGGVYAGIDGTGYVGVFGSPALYQTNTGWVDLPTAQGFNTALQIYGSAAAISHDGSVVAGSVTGTTTNGVSKQVAAYWVNGIESVIPAPPDDPGAAAMSVTAVSGDGTALLVQDQGNVNSLNYKVETYVYNLASGTFTSLGFIGFSNQQTYATAINKNGTVVAGYGLLDNNNLSGFIWNATNGVTLLGTPADFTNNSFIYLEPTCMSDDGATLFGRLSVGGGWGGFRYNTATGYQDLGDSLGLAPSACTADGTEAVGIADLYFPAVWSVTNGSGFLDHLVSENIATQALGTLSSPVTISPDGTAITCNGPDAYPVDQIWYGAWQVLLPFPLKTAPIVPGNPTPFSTPYQETLTEPAGTLTQYDDFNTGVSAVLVSGPHYASSFVLNTNGGFTYTPKPGYISAGVDPETGTPTDSFTYKLIGPGGTSSNAVVQITVLAPTFPLVDTPAYANVTGTTATLGGTVEGDGGAALLAVGVVYAPTSVNSSPQLGGAGVSSAAGTAALGVFTVGVSNLVPNTLYSYAAYATNSEGISYSTTDSFFTPANFQWWQTQWYGSAANTNAASNADPYHTGVANLMVFAFLGPNQDPSAVSMPQLPQVQLSGGNFFYDFFEPAGVSGLTYGADTSADLSPGSWLPVPDTGLWPEHIFSVPTAGNSQMFMRLTVTAQ